MENPKPQQDEDGFVKPNPRSRANKKQSKSQAGNNPEVWNNPEGWDKTNKGAEADKDTKNLRKSENKHQTSPPTDQIIRRNRESVQLRWKEKSETTTPPCKKQRERWK
jgi:hypothetical protein